MSIREGRLPDGSPGTFIPLSDEAAAAHAESAERMAAAREGSEASQEVTRGIVSELAHEQAQVQERLGMKSLGEHAAEAEAAGYDMLTDPRILARARELRPTPQQQRDEQVYRDAQIAAQARRDFEQAQVRDPHMEPIHDFVEDDFDADDEKESVYRAIDSAVDSWTEEDVAEYERLKAEQGAVSAYQQEQDDAA
jgi:hypothetical protein